MNKKDMHDLLSSYYDNKGSILPAIDEYESINSIIYSLNAAMMADKVSSGSTNDKLEKALIIMELRAQKVLDNVVRYTEKADEIDRLIEKVRAVKSSYGAILEQYYIDEKTHAEIGESIHYSEDYVGDLKQNALGVAVDIVEGEADGIAS